MNAHSLEAKLGEYDARLSFFDMKLKPITSRPIGNREDREAAKKRPHPSTRPASDQRLKMFWPP